MLSLVTQRVQISNPIISALARESLTVYLIHLCILYGSIWNTGLRQIVGPHLTPLECVKVICVLLLSMILLAYTWNLYKRNESQGLRVARFAMFFLTMLYTVT
jgi:surface polysaccharide O-acyltransferase-like enzyme